MKRILLIISVILLGLAVRAQSVTYTCRYWFDQNFGQAVTTTFSESTWQVELDVGSLAEGLHSLHLHVMDTSMKWSAPLSYLFLKVDVWENWNPNYVYHCWFDQDFANEQSDVIGNGYFLLDVTDLEEGMHSVNVMLEGSALTATQTYEFIKIAVQDPSNEMQYVCWFDQDYDNKQRGLLGNGIFELEVGDLPNGIHTVNVQLDNGLLSAPLCYLFYKQPLGGYGITRWEYWVNDDFEDRQTTNFNPQIDSLAILALLPVGHPAIRSNCFHFHPNGEEPYINAKNQINFRIWDVENLFLDKSAFFVDEQVQQDIVAQVFERNTTETFAAPRDNQIQWFKLDAVVGDSLSFIASKACTMQLFAPSGEEVFNVSGPESITLKGLHAWENGTYYLAVHDMTGSGETISVTYNWVYRYAILAYDVHLVGNGGCSTITFQGNGFNSLLDVYLVNWQNDTIHRLDIGHESNTTTTVTFDFYQKNLGVYDAVFQFYEETIRINGALEMQEPVDIVLTSSVSYPSQFLRNTPCTYTYTITNNGNMSAYGVPIFVYVATPTEDGISHLEFEGLDMASLIDNLALDTISLNEIAEIKNLIDGIGDEINFNLMRLIDEETRDTIVARSNFFFINLAPFETKTLKLKITADEVLDVWMTIPNEVIQPIVFDTNRGIIDRWCCVHEKVECYLTLLATGLNIASLVSTACGLVSLALGPEAAPVTAVLLTIGNSATIASCFASALSTTISVFNDVVCAETDESFLNKLRQATKNSGKSIIGALFSCIPLSGYKEGVKAAQEAIKFLKKALLQQIRDLGTDVGALSLSDFDCLKQFHDRKPNCPRGDSDGGPSDPVNSLDPNDIHGYLSESSSHYMRQEIQNIHYEIEFENDTTLATAAAHTIIVRDTLDATKFDLNSLAAHSVTIGDKRLELHGEQNFARTLDMRPELYVIAQINQDYDPSTGIIEWTIQSLDPMTMEPTDDPNQGVLPVNYFGDGVGFIDYSINLKQAFADGTEVSNRAGIIFDQEDIIMTPTWTNIVDAVKPTSHIEEVTPVADSLSFSFVSEDNRSGVWYHTLYYRNDSTYQEWQVRKAQIFEDNFMLHLEDLQTTEYLVMAVDSAGNHEEKDMVAEYIFNSDDFDYSIFTTAGNWSTASNWQGGALPTADDVVFIEAPCQLDQNATVAALNVSNGQSLTLQSGNTLTVTGNLTNTVAANLVIEDGAQLVNASENVAATVKKDVTAYGIGNPSAWHTIASPVSGMSIAGSGFVTPEYDLYRYDETNLNGEEWENYKANLADFTTFEKGRGYLFANSNSFSPVFIGMLNNTDVTCSLTYTNRPNDPLSGFNLIGNPFPHNIYKGAGAAIDNANLASGYYTLTNEGVWQAHTYEDAILPGQGILVKTNAPTTLTIAKSNAEATSESSEAERSKGSLSISVAGDNGQDQAYVYFGQGIGLDKVKSIALDAPSLAVRNGNGDFAIAHCDKKSDAVELVFTTPDEGSFTMDVNVVAGDFDYLHLIDSLTGVDVDLLATPSYTFEASARDDASRFRLVFSIKGN